MARRLDVSTLEPEHARKVLQQREQKRRSYAARGAEIRARNRAWQEAHPDLCAEMHRQWRLANPERKAANTRASYERNREAAIARQAARDQSLCDATVRSRFCDGHGLQSKDVPQELIPAIRQSILIKRELKKLKKEAS